MTEWGVFGVVIGMLGFLGTAYSMFYKPSHDLKIEMVKLNSNLEQLRSSDMIQTTRLDKHSKQLDDHEHKIIDCEHDIKDLKKDVEYIRRETGRS